MSNITLECRECKTVLLEKDFTKGSETEFRICISCSEKEIILERCLVCGWVGCDIDHKKDQKTMEFIEACRKVHLYRFGYENTVYVRCSDKVIINCVYHGNFEQAAIKHKIRKQGCKICSGMDPKTAEDNFRKQISELGGEVVGEYIRSNHPVKCKCKKGHICNPIPSSIRRGQGMCRICAGIDSKTSEDNFRKRINELGGKVIGEYKTNRDKVQCKCKKGHICNPAPSDIQQGHGMCRVCTGTDPKTAEDNFRKRINELGGFVIGKYINSKTKVKCKCEKIHICNPAPSDIKQGRNMCLTCSRSGYSQAQISWLNYIQDEEKINIRHAENGGEFRIGKYKVDGYCKDTNTVYEFHGDFWHGNPKFYEHTDTNPVNKKSFGQLLKATLHKEMSIRKSGYNYKCIWECEWNLMKN